jgi:hypothetical protein
MQVTPEVGRDTAKRFGVPYDWTRLVSEPVYHTQVGTAELAALLREYRGSPITAQRSTRATRTERRGRRAAAYLKIRPVAMLSASAPTSRARSMRSVLISGGRSAPATWALVKTDVLPCESIPASVAARRANPRSRSLKSAELCWSGQREEGIDCGGFSAPAASVDVSGVDCPVRDRLCAQR